MKLFLQSILHGSYSSRLLFAVMTFFCLLISPVKAQNVSCSLANKVYTAPGQMGKAYAILNNWERNTLVHQVGYTLHLNGKTTEERTIALDAPLDYNGSATIAIDIPAGTQPGLDNFFVTIVSVNGAPNRNFSPTSGSERYTLSRPVWRKAVVEDLTGMWCPNCPTGIASLEHLNKVASDRVIGLAAHDGDALNAGDYYHVFRKFPGRPKIVLNGAHVVAPYYGNSGTDEQPFGLLADVEKASGAQSAVELKVQAAWTSDHKGIEVRSSTTFRYPVSENKYRLAYVLTADNLRYPSFYQYNNAAGDSRWANSVPEMKFFYNAPSTVRDLPFNDVVFAATGIY